MKPRKKPRKNQWYLDLPLDERIRANKMIRDLIKKAYTPSSLAVESVRDYFKSSLENKQQLKVSL